MGRSFSRSSTASDAGASGFFIDVFAGVVAGGDPSGKRSVDTSEDSRIAVDGEVVQEDGTFIFEE